MNRGKSAVLVIAAGLFIVLTVIACLGLSALTLTRIFNLTPVYLEGEAYNDRPMAELPIFRVTNSMGLTIGELHAYTIPGHYFIGREPCEGCFVRVVALPIFRYLGPIPVNLIIFAW